MWLQVLGNPEGSDFHTRTRPHPHETFFETPRSANALRAQTKTPNHEKDTDSIRLRCLDLCCHCGGCREDDNDYDHKHHHG